MTKTNDELHIKPADGDLIVRDEITRQPLAKQGERKPRTLYWLKRLRDGDVIELNALELNPENKSTKASSIKAKKKSIQEGDQ